MAGRPALDAGHVRQADPERWLPGGEASHHYQAGQFVRWAASQRLAMLSYPATCWQGVPGLRPCRPSDGEQLATLPSERP